MSHPDILKLSHLVFTIYSFITDEFFFTCQLTHYLNGYIESSCELAKEVKKSRLEAEMLRRAKEKAEREVRKVSMKVDAVKRRAEDIEAMLRKVVKENSRLLGKAVEFEAQAKRNAAAYEENSCLQKEIKELKAQLGAAEKQTAEAASKAVEDFQALEEYKEARAKYSVTAYMSEDSLSESELLSNI